jgi:localization factor PodJL
MPAAPDPTTTASISPAETSAAAEPDTTMPPPLATSGDSTAATVASIAPTPLATGAPPALKSPVKVEMPPDSVGPLALRQAAADGDARAQFEIGAIYSEGKVVPQDFKQASVWYERAAEQGFAPAEYRLGNLYETGKGVTKDYEQAHLWYERAADAGNRMAMHNLAALFAGGEFGKQDFASAANWFEKAANLGIRDSQFNLGMLYARGLGVPQNLETSYKWFALAAQTGDSGAIKARDDIARSLDADQLKAAKAEVAAFKPGTVDLAANFAPIGTWDKKFDPGPTITNKSVVLKVQEALAHLGFDIGKPDGQAGPKTAQAIKAFEQGTGMSQVGAINPRLLAVLGSQPV